MLTSLTLLFLAHVPALESASPELTPSTHQALAVVQTPAPKDDEFPKLKKEAGKDVTKLWKLYEWCKEHKRDKEAKSTLKDLVKIDPLHKEANIALGNLFHDGKWFENQKKIDEYIAQQVIEAKKAQGLVEYKGEWVPKEDVPFLEKGLAKDDFGNWVSGEDAKKLKAGFIKQDLAWIPPTEKENIDKGLWKCGDMWLSLADADKYHAEMYQEWRIPFLGYNVWSTCDRDLVNSKIKRQLDPAMDDLERIYGMRPAKPINVFIFRALDQYNSYAAGDEEMQKDPTEMQPLSSAYYAYFGDLIFDDTAESLNMGVTYWDATTEVGGKWGVHQVRHAIAQSYAEGLDPSPLALAALRKSGRIDNSYYKKFYGEKRIPTWLRYGAAGYVELYFNDTTVGMGGDAQWAKKWTIGNLLKLGGMRPLKQVLDCRIKPADPDDVSKLIKETGLVVAFMVDGKCAPVMEKHKALKEALKSGADKKAVDEAVKALEAEILKNEAELRKFAGL
ncbi:MAG: hypothetical protein JNL28_08350 [Planctomycetes bacterium]|nr:hypothetical protein [Planctomycetota bacterium]